MSLHGGATGFQSHLHPRDSHGRWTHTTGGRALPRVTRTEAANHLATAQRYARRTLVHMRKLEKHRAAITAAAQSGASNDVIRNHTLAAAVAYRDVKQHAGVVVAHSAMLREQVGLNPSDATILRHAQAAELEAHAAMDVFERARREAGGYENVQVPRTAPATTPAVAPAMRTDAQLTTIPRAEWTPEEVARAQRVQADAVAAVAAAAQAQAAASPRVETITRAPEAAPASASPITVPNRRLRTDKTAEYHATKAADYRRIGSGHVNEATRALRRGDMARATAKQLLAIRAHALLTKHLAKARFASVRSNGVSRFHPTRSVEEQHAANREHVLSAERSFTVSAESLQNLHRRFPQGQQLPSAAQNANAAPSAPAPGGIGRAIHVSSPASSGDLEAALRTIDAEKSSPMATEDHPSFQGTVSADRRARFEAGMERVTGKRVTFSEMTHAFGAAPEGYHTTLGSLGDSSVTFNIHDSATGRKIGEIDRNFSKDYDSGEAKVYHALFRIDDVHQGKQIQETLNGAALRRYEKWGIKKVGVTAGLDVGRWQWANMGFHITSSGDRENIASSLRSFVNARPDLRPHVEQIVAEGKRRLREEPWTFATWSLDHPTTGQPMKFPNPAPPSLPANPTPADHERVERLRNVAFGPAVMLNGPSWGGTLRVDRDNPGYLRAITKLKVATAEHVRVPTPPEQKKRANVASGKARSATQTLGERPGTIQEHRDAQRLHVAASRLHQSAARVHDGAEATSHQDVALEPQRVAARHAGHADDMQRAATELEERERRAAVSRAADVASSEASRLSTVGMNGPSTTAEHLAAETAHGRAAAAHRQGAQNGLLDQQAQHTRLAESHDQSFRYHAGERRRLQTANASLTERARLASAEARDLGTRAASLPGYRAAALAHRSALDAHRAALPSSVGQDHAYHTERIAWHTQYEQHHLNRIVAAKREKKASRRSAA